MMRLAKLKLTAAMGAVALAALTAGCATSGGSDSSAYRSSAYYVGADRLYRDNFVRNTRPHLSPNDPAAVYANPPAPAPRSLAAFDGIAGARLAEHSPRRDVPYTVRIVDTPEPNAFALPGGFVYVSRGLLALANSEGKIDLLREGAKGRTAPIPAASAQGGS